MTANTIKFKPLKFYIDGITNLLEKLYSTSSRNPLEMLVDDLWCEFGQKHPFPLSKKEREIIFEATSLYGEAVYCYPFEDILGPIYMELAGRGHKKAMGQFFTPTSVCELMASLTLHDASAEIEQRAKKNESIKICEPCCGAGAILMAAIKNIYSNNPALLPYVEIWGVDKERLCARMCGAQILCNLMIHKVSLGILAIVWGDALTVEEYETICFAEHKDRKPYAAIERFKMLQECINIQNHWKSKQISQPVFPIAL